MPEVLTEIICPKSRRENLEFREMLPARCEQDPVLLNEVKDKCRRDILFWINTFCWTKDPRRQPDILPFITYPFQDRHILEVQSAINKQEDYLNDKSRDMGVSWDVLYVLTHFWLFEDGSDFRVGSRKEDYVDKLNDIDTLLEKVRFNLKKQPLWLLPKGFNLNDHAGYMRIINPENNNAIIGESANEHFGSGGRRKALLLDEFAKWEEKIAEAAWTATADVTKCRIVVSTPVGSGNKFAQLASGTKEKIKKTSLHWTLHPLKAEGAYYLTSNGEKVPISSPEEAYKLYLSGIKVRSPWYDAEAERRSEADLAQEVDIDYLRSGHPFFSLTELAKQRVWDYMVRKTPMDPIPNGKHIRVNLVNIDNKIEIREVSTGWLRIFELPRVGQQYVLSADTAEGLAKGDESFLTIRDKWTRNVVAAANGSYPTDDWAIKIQIAGKFYKEADVVPENNNHGHSVCQDLKGMDCKLYQTKHVNPNNEKETIIKPGFTTTAQSRPAMLDQLEEEIRKGAIELRDEVIIAQCKTFVFNAKNGKPEADGAFLDDGVIATAIGSAIIKELPYKAKPSENFKEKKQQAARDLSKPIGAFK